MQVKPLDRTEIDGWPVDQAGLPVRVVNAVRRVPVKTVGQLRTLPESDLHKLKSLGRISLGHIREFFRLCGQIEQGKLRLAHLKDAFALLLDEPEIDVLSVRYGLNRESLKAQRNHETLQQIADRLHLTRERVRQIQDAGLSRLRTRLAQTCLQPFYDALAEEIDRAGRVLDGEGLAPLQEQPPFAGTNLCGSALLLSDVAPERLTSYQGYFSTLPPADVRAMEARLVEALRKAAAPMPLDELCRRAGASDQPAPAACALDHCPAVAATLDQRYFLFENGAAPFLIDVLSRLERPVHFRKITAAFNEQLKPAKRKGAGYVLDLLGGHPRFSRVDRGVYDLKAK